MLHVEDRHADVGLTDDDLLGMYRTALRARVLDDKIRELDRSGKAAFVVSSQGREGAQVGAAWCIRRDVDVVLPSRRDVGVMLTLGMTAEEILLAVLARADDPNSGGRQLPNHWSDPRHQVISRSPVVGAHLPHGVGIAYALRQRGAGGVAVCFLDEGDVHETLDFATRHRLPVVFVRERAGSDPLDIYAAMHRAMQRARAGEGPSLVECTAWRETDPLQRMRQYVVERGVLPEGDAHAFEAEVRAEVDEAARRAEAAPMAEGRDASTFVYARPVPAAQKARPVPRAGVERNVIETVRWTLHERMAADERVIVLGRDVGPRGGVFRATEGLTAAFGERRVLGTPLSESSIVGIGIGMALAGMRPVVEIQFADLIHSAFDQIVGEAAKLHYRSAGGFAVPLVIRTPWGGGVHGGLYHSQAIEAFFGHVAGVKVVAPSTPADVCGLLREAIDDPDPVLFLEHKRTYRSVTGPVPEDPSWRVPIGVADIARAGDDCTIVTYGWHRHLAVDAADALDREYGYSVEVVDLRTISPLDRATVIESACRTGRVLIVHEDNVTYGVGAEIAAIVAEEAFYDLDAPVRRLAMPDVPAFPFAAPLEAALSIGADDILAAARSLLEE